MSDRDFEAWWESVVWTTSDPYEIAAEAWRAALAAKDERARKAIQGPGAPRRGHYGYDGQG